MFNLILFGPPGAGKGTQAKKIAEKYHLIHVSTGDIFRAEIANRSPLGLHVKDIIEKGELVPDPLLIEILLNLIKKNNPCRGFVFDGFPRTLNQAKMLDSMLQKQGEKVTMILSLEVEETELIRRILGRGIDSGRIDDTEEVVKNRLKVYHLHTKPLMDYYAVHGLFKRIFGKGTVGDVFESLCQEIDALI